MKSEGSFKHNFNCSFVSLSHTTSLFHYFEWSKIVKNDKDDANIFNKFPSFHQSYL